MSTSNRRAAPLALSDRKAAIIAAVTPLLATRGAAVTSRDLAEAAGVAEGTLFRAFESKENLIHAVLENYLDADLLKERFAVIPDDAGIEDVVARILHILSDRVAGLFVIASAVERKDRGPHQNRHPHDKRAENLAKINTVIAERLERHASQLSVSPDKAAEFVRGIAFSAALPHARGVSDIASLSVDELTALALHGLKANTA